MADKKDEVYDETGRKVYYGKAIIPAKNSPISPEVLRMQPAAGARAAAARCRKRERKAKELSDKYLRVRKSVRVATRENKASSSAQLNFDASVGGPKLAEVQPMEVAEVQPMKVAEVQPMEVVEVQPMEVQPTVLIKEPDVIPKKISMSTVSTQTATKEAGDITTDAKKMDVTEIEGGGNKSDEKKDVKEEDVTSEMGNVEAEAAQGEVKAAQGEGDAVQDEGDAVQDEGGAAQGKGEAAQGKDEAAQGKDEAAQGKDEAAQGEAEAAQGKGEATQGEVEAAQGEAKAAQGEAEGAQGETETAQGEQEEKNDAQNEAQEATEPIAIDEVKPMEKYEDIFAQNEPGHSSQSVSGETGTKTVPEDTMKRPAGNQNVEGEGSNDEKKANPIPEYMITCEHGDLVQFIQPDESIDIFHADLLELMEKQ